MKPHALALTLLFFCASFALPAQPVVPATVSFSAADPGMALNPEFCGLSYEKAMLLKNLFVPTNTALINLFNLIGPGVFRIGANQVDTTCWNGLAGKKAITPAQVDQLAGFIKATQWRVIYAVNMSVNTPENAASEAGYAAKALGSSLLGFEIGNECDLYHKNGFRPTNYNYLNFREEWRRLAASIHAAVPGAALTGPADASNNGIFSVPFANDEAGTLSMLTSHYYRGDGRKPASTLPFLLKPDPNAVPRLKKAVAAATAAKLPLGFHCDECGSYYNGGAPNVSNGYGTALWALDFMFLNAVNGCQGVNFHGGGRGNGYTPIADDGTNVVQVRPEFYGMKMFSLAGRGTALPATLTTGSPVNFTAYGVRTAGGGMNIVLINKDTDASVQATLNLPGKVASLKSMALTGPALGSTSGYTIGGAAINADGSWTGGFQSVTPAADGKLTITVPPISAVLLETDGR